MTLARYINRHYLINLVFVSCALLTVVATFDFFEQLRLLSGYDVSLGQVSLLTVIRVPTYIPKYFPLFVLLAAIMTFVRLSRTSEMVITRASGMSALRVLMLPIASTVAIGLLLTVAWNPVVASALKLSDRLNESYTSGSANLFSLSEQGIWLRQGTDERQYVIQAERTDATGHRLFPVRIHEFTSEGSLLRRIEARSAQLEFNAWRLEDARVWRVHNEAGEPLSGYEDFDAYIIPSDLSSDQILENFADPRQISIWELPGFIEKLERSGFTAVRHRLRLQTEMARPLLLMAMIMIGAGFSIRHARFGQTGVMILIAVLSGFVLYTIRAIAESLGAAEQIPLTLAAWGPSTAAVFLTLGLLLHLEDG